MDSKKKKNKTRAYQPFLHKGFSYKSHFRENPALNCLLEALNCLPALGSCHVSQPLKGSYWNITLTSKTEAFPIQNWSCAPISPISIFTNQSDQLHSDQSGQSLWTNQTARIWNPYLHEDRPIRDPGQRLLSIQAGSLWALLRGHFPLSLKAVSPWLS